MAEAATTPVVPYLQTPTVLQTTVFTELPEALRTSHPASGKNEHFLEGPSFDAAGNLYCVDIPAGRIYRISPAGDWQVVSEYGGQPNGLKFHRDGRIFVADRAQGIVVVDPTSGEASVLCAGPRPGERFKGLNDLIFAGNGDLYFTDQGRSGLQDPSGVVYRIRSGETAPEPIISNVPSPNGLVFNMRETELFVAVTRANAVWRVELTDPLHRCGLYVQLPSAGPDGLALDADGNVVVAHPTGGLVWVYSKRGAPLYAIPSCRGDMPSNIAYGDDDGRTLYIVESRTCSILTTRLPTAGKPMFGPARQE